MKLNKPTADLYVPDGAPAPFARCTHLGIGAHQDDLEIFAYDAIAECFGQSDKWFGGVTVTDGRGSSRADVYSGYSDDDMVNVRREEQRAAALMGRYAFQAQLDYPSKEIKDAGNGEVVADIVSLIESSKPEVVYIHNLADKHDTHVALALRCITALRQASHKPSKVYGVEVWRNLDWMVDAEKQLLRVDARPSLASSLLGVFDSQVTGGKRYDLAAVGRRLANATFFESHESDDSQGYNYAMDLTPLVRDASVDPIAYTTGFIDRLKQDVSDRISKFQG